MNIYSCSLKAMKNNQSATRLKSKHIQNKTTKIKLTDLCPQQKAKIGQLIKTLENIKNQNIGLKKQVQTLSNTINSLQGQKQNLMSQRQKDLQNITYLEQQVRVCQKQNTLKDKMIKQLKQSIVDRSSRNFLTLNTLVQTEEVYKLNASVQTKIKRKKNKEKSIQTQFQGPNSRGFNTFRPKTNSKSFQKIMSSKYSLQPAHMNLLHKKDLQKDQLNEQQESDSPNYDNYRKKIMDQVENEQQDSDDQGFEQLAQKWLQIKQKNMSKLKQEYQKSKKKVLKSQNNHTDFSNDSSQLNARIKQLEQKQPVFHNKHRPFRQRTVQQEEEECSQDNGSGNGLLFNDIELNKVLKSRNFSASRLINSQTSNSNARSRQNNDNSRSRQKNKRSVHQGNTQSFGTSARHKQVDFYQPDLFDLVASIENNK